MSRVFIGIVAGVLLLGAAPSRSSPTAIVQSAYAWSNNHNFMTETSGLQPYFTPTLYADLQKILRVDKCTHKADIDADIFSGAQVATYGYHVGAATIHGGTATVAVTVLAGLSRSRAQNILIRVLTVRGADGWRISDIMVDVNNSYGSLLQQLQRDVADLGAWSRHWTAAQRSCVGPV